MGVPTHLTDADGTELHTEKFGDHTHMVFEQHARVHGQFKAGSLSDAGTAVIVTPPSGAAIVVTDFTYSIEKVASGLLTVQFDDDTRAVILFQGVSVDAPLVGAFSPQGRFRGWKDARIDMVAVGTNASADVTVGYYFVTGDAALPFDEWDGLR